MPTIQPWESDLIIWLRAALPDLVGLFEVITSLGGETFFLVLLPLLYWCLDRRVGARVTVLFLISTYVNGVAKVLFDLPRPLDAEPERLAALFPEGIDVARERYDATGNGFPSGHTQSTVVLWSYLAAQANRARASWQARQDPTNRRDNLLFPALIALAALFMVLVPLSRVYLAVHYPTDVFGGYLFALLVLLLFAWLSPGGEAQLTRAPLAWQLGVAIGPPIVGLFAVPTEYTTTAAATLLGMGVGFVLERRWVGFSTDGSLPHRAGRLVLGIAVLGALYAGLKVVFSDFEPHLLFRAIRYTLLGLWGALGAPYAFVNLRLAPSRAKAQKT